MTRLGFEILTYQNKIQMKKEIKEQNSTDTKMGYDTVLANVDLKKVEKYLKTPEAQAELNRIANEPIKKWSKPTWEELNTPMDI